MAMKYILLYRFLPPDARAAAKSFKWQWRVVWRSAGNKHLSSSSPFPTRAEARQYKSIVPSHYKPRIQRRLVQTNWQDYSDTFTYNAKGNGNGR